MPTYEYRCLDCRKRFSVFLTYADYGIKPVACRHCGSLHVERRIGRIRVAHSDESRLEGMADPSQLEGLDEDPRALGRMMRQMKSSVGEDMGPVFDEVVDRLEAGQSPEDIDSAIPDLGSDLGAGDDF
ncbi:MAG TPA: zinc ribbon domain-containing protein [Anaerolineaceae bacterium]|nr:zinc ribbon domain-containing protein [Anaerolineaceae bacterium]